MPALLENKKAYFNYEILEKYEAGLELLGLEVKSLKLKRGNIAGARVLVRGGETFVVGMDIPPYQPKTRPKITSRKERESFYCTKKKFRISRAKPRSAA